MQVHARGARRRFELDDPGGIEGRRSRHAVIMPSVTHSERDRTGRRERVALRP
jgi:hypothetical protein